MRLTPIPIDRAVPRGYPARCADLSSACGRLKNSAKANDRRFSLINPRKLDVFDLAPGIFSRCLMCSFEILKFGSSVLRSPDDLPVAVDEIYRRWRPGSHRAGGRLGLRGRPARINWSERLTSCSRPTRAPWRRILCKASSAPRRCCWLRSPARASRRAWWNRVTHRLDRYRHASGEHAPSCRCDCAGTALERVPGVGPAGVLWRGHPRMHSAIRAWRLGHVGAVFGI